MPGRRGPRTLCEQIGDYRQWGDSTVVLAESALIAGDVEYALNIQKILLEDARRRRNPLQAGWGLFGVAANNVRLGKEASAIPMLEEALQILEEIPNLASSINTNAQLALVYLRLGQDEKALTYADKVLELAADISPTVYSLDLGFAAVAEVYFELWERVLKDPSRRLDPDTYKLSAERAIKLLQAFRKVFPIGQAYVHYYRGWYEELMGKPQLALRSWRQRLGSCSEIPVAL